MWLSFVLGDFPAVLSAGMFGEGEGVDSGEGEGVGSGEILWFMISPSMVSGFFS